MATALEDPAVRRILMVTAWVRESGMRPILEGLQALASRGGRAEMLVGVDLKGTTEQGLELALRSVDNLFVVHDPEGRTFHPKVYLAMGETVGYALLGSNNLTAGGLGFNYEVAATCTFDPRHNHDFVHGIEAYARKLIADTPICRRVTPHVLARLKSEGWLADERSDRRHRTEDRTRARGMPTGARDPLFSSSGVEKRTRTIPASRRQSGRRPGRPRGAATAPDSWSKQLGPGDAQRPARGNPTGVVRLTAPPLVADRARFFRRVFFGGQHWRRTRDANGNAIEIATILVDAEINNRALGTKTMTVDYGAYRDVRGRATTVLHWGDLMAELRVVDVTDWYLLIERGPRALRVRLTPTRPV